MKKLLLLLLTVSVLLLFTACSPVREPPPEKEKPDLEELVDCLYVDYDRSKFENVAAPPKPYYAEYVTFEDDDMIPFFSAPPTAYTIMSSGIYPERNFQNGGESGYYDTQHGAFRQEVLE